MPRQRLILCLLLLLGVSAALAQRSLRASMGNQNRIFWPNGMRRAEGRGRPGAEEGQWSYWYSNGQIRESGNFSNGHRIGDWTQWHLNGQRATRGERIWSAAAKASVKHGAWSEWHENGAPRSQGAFEMGARAGDWEFWRPTGEGSLLDEEQSGHYQAGRKVE